jgi:hypothetical protein
MKGLRSKKTKAEVATPKRNYPWFQIILVVIMTAQFITAILNEDAEERKVSVIHYSSIYFFYIIWGKIRH